MFANKYDDTFLDTPLSANDLAHALEKMAFYLLPVFQMKTKLPTGRLRSSAG